jgi:hypothetical protein
MFCLLPLLPFASCLSPLACPLPPRQLTPCLAKVREATKNESWGSSTSIMFEVAEGTKYSLLLSAISSLLSCSRLPTRSDYDEFPKIVNIIFKRMGTDTYRETRIQTHINTKKHTREIATPCIPVVFTSASLHLPPLSFNSLCLCLFSPFSCRRGPEVTDAHAESPAVNRIFAEERY